MKNYLRLLRPKHYVKNVLVLLPLFFSGRFFERMPLCVGLPGFAAFKRILYLGWCCLISEHSSRRW